MFSGGYIVTLSYLRPQLLSLFLELLYQLMPQSQVALSCGKTVSGSWSKQESTCHINYLELKAIKLCILSFLKYFLNNSVRILSDNISAVFYLKKMGGTHSQKMCQLSIGIWNLLIDNNISISVFHIRGINTLADHCSRLTNKNDYALCSDGIKLLLSFLPFQPKIDLFASRLTTKLP